MDRVEIQTLKELPLFVWRQQIIVHKLLKRFKALDIDPYCIFIAFLCPVKRILLRIADTSQETHGSFVSPVGCLFLRNWIATSCLARLGFALVARAVGYEMRRVTVAENGEGFIEA
ncbi:hypothetical protein HG531_006395 [Fusarium graminearum]|nr:hypothetical protein HG531_006395 [Fusarium graminearum]